MLWPEIGTRGIPCSHVGQLHRAWHVPKCSHVRRARADINSRHELLMAKDDGQHACSEVGFLPARSCRSNSAGLAAPLSRASCRHRSRRHRRGHNNPAARPLGYSSDKRSAGKQRQQGNTVLLAQQGLLRLLPTADHPQCTGHKATYSCLVQMNYVNLGQVDNQCRVTFEAENNLDFRLGTGPLRYSRLADEGDLAAISRVGETSYEIRLFRQRSAEYTALLLSAVHMIGHQGKRYGYMPNAEFAATVGLPVIGWTRARTRAH